VKKLYNVFYLKYERYGHTKSFSNRKERCVKCAEDHSTFNCPCKDKSKDVRCVLIIKLIIQAVWFTKIYRKDISLPYRKKITNHNQKLNQQAYHKNWPVWSTIQNRQNLSFSQVIEGSQFIRQIYWVTGINNISKHKIVIQDKYYKYKKFYARISERNERVHEKNGSII